MGEQSWSGAALPVEPSLPPLVWWAHALELATCPPDDIGIDPLQGRTQLRPVEVAVVGDRAAHARVVNMSAQPSRTGTPGRPHAAQQESGRTTEGGELTSRELARPQRATEESDAGGREKATRSPAGDRRRRGNQGRGIRKSASKPPRFCPFVALLHELRGT